MIGRPVNPGGRGGADLQSTYLPTLEIACQKKNPSNRIFQSHLLPLLLWRWRRRGSAACVRACGGADLTVRACVRRRGSNRACGGVDLTVRRRGSNRACGGADLTVRAAARI
jgi:hypothetical protein